MYLKIHKSYRDVVALCDADLIGKSFEEGNKVLDCRENFYKDKKVDLNEAMRVLRKESDEDATFNIVGEKSIQAAIESGLITKDEVARVAGIPFSLVLV